MNIPESLPVGIGDLECVAFFDYQPPEPDVNAGESVTLEGVELGGMDITGLISREEMAELEETLLIDLHEYMSDWQDAKADHQYQLRKDREYE